MRERERVPGWGGETMMADLKMESSSKAENGDCKAKKSKSGLGHSDYCGLKKILS